MTLAACCSGDSLSPSLNEAFFRKNLQEKRIYVKKELDVDDMRYVETILSLSIKDIDYSILDDDYNTNNHTNNIYDIPSSSDDHLTILGHHRYEEQTAARMLQCMLN